MEWTALCFRVHIGEAPTATDELETAGLTGAGVGGVLEHRRDGLRELGEPAQGVRERSSRHGADRMTASTIGRFSQALNQATPAVDT